MTSLKDPEGEKDKYCMISLTCIIQEKTNKKTKLTDTENRRWLPEVRTRESMKSVTGQKSTNFQL